MEAKFRNQQGIALIMVLMIVMILLALTGATLLFSGLNLKQASNLKSGSGALYSADAGIHHGLTLLPTGTDFNSLLQGSVTGFPCASPCNGTSNKPTLTGTLSTYNYSVVAENDPNDTGGPTNDTNRLITLTSTANGTNSSRRKITAFIGRSTTSWVPPGAVYIPGSTTSQEAFDPGSTTFTVTGNDTNYNNTSGPQPSIPGMATTNAAVTGSIVTSLGTDARKQRVTGTGYVAGPPVTPSVQTTTRTDDINAMATNFTNQIPVGALCPPKCTSGLNYNLTTCPSTSPCVLGTDAAPQITYITGTTSVSLGGYVNGSGVLVVQANELALQGNFNFHGLVIHLQSTQIGTSLEFTINGSAQIYGGLILGPNSNQLEFEIDQSAAIRYSSQAINMVNTNWFSCCLPKPVKLTAWVELMQ